MKVCLHVLSPLRTNIRAVRAVTALAQAGFMITLVDIEHHSSRSNDKDLAAKFIITPKEQEIENVNLRHIFLPERFALFYEPTHALRWLLFKALRMVYAIVVLLRTPADIYHASDLTALPACYIAALMHHKPLILEVYDMPLVSPQTMRWKWLYILCRRVLKLMVSRCYVVISPSPQIVQEMKRCYGSKAGMLLRNMPPYQPPPTSNHIRDYLNLSPRTRIVLYQGILMKDRGLDVIIPAARFLNPNIVIVFMGKGEMQAELQALIRQEGVTERVKMIPSVPYAELLTWTASTDVGLIIYRPDSPNVHMMLPNKLFEYLMAGVPILASPLEAVVEIVETYGVGHIVRSQQPEDVAKAINTLLANEEARVQMRINALAASQRDLNWNVESHKLVQLYYDILPEFRADESVLQR
jgi:glycosyltransferase involved in cell wall biosynthesis